MTPTDETLALLRALAAAPSALLTENDCAALWGLDERGGALAVAGLLDDDLLSVWRRGDGDALILSPLAAERVGVDLLASADLNELRWVPAGADVAAEPARRRRGKGEVLETDAFPADHLSKLDGLADPRSREPGRGGEDEHPQATEYLIQRRMLDATVVVGVGVPWPTAVPKPGVPCAACGGKPLGKNECCCYCDATGLKLPPVPACERPQPYHDPAEGDLAGGVGKGAKPGRPRGPKAGNPSGGQASPKRRKRAG